MTTATRSERPPVLTAWRCPSCNNLLAKVALVPGSRVEIKCYRCNWYAVKEAS